MVISPNDESLLIGAFTQRVLSAMNGPSRTAALAKANSQLELLQCATKN